MSLSEKKWIFNFVLNFLLLMYTSWSISNIYFLFLKHVLFCLPILLNTQTVSLPTQNTPEKTNLKTLLKNFYWRSLSHTFCIQKAATFRQYCTWKFVCVTISISETSIYAKKIKKNRMWEIPGWSTASAEIGWNYSISHCHIWATGKFKKGIHYKKTEL